MRCRIGSLGLKMLVLVFTLALGVSLTRLVHRVPNPHTNFIDPSQVLSVRADYDALPRVNYCDLMAAPDAYEGKFVLFPIKPHERGMLRSDEICVKGDPRFNIEFVGGDLRESDVDKFWSGGNVTLAGRFTKSPRAGHLPIYQFQIVQIVEARLFVAPH